MNVNNCLNKYFIIKILITCYFDFLFSNMLDLLVLKIVLHQCLIIFVKVPNFENQRNTSMSKSLEM